MTQQTDIKTLEGGSIDYAHYMARGRQIRSNDAHRALAAMWQMLRAAWAVVTPLALFQSGSEHSQSAGYPLVRSAKRSPILRVDACEGKTSGKPKALSVSG